MSSVLLNFNKNLDNGDAFKFSQFYDDKIRIPENATISLNNAQLTRKAIVVVEDTPITINLTNPNNKDLAEVLDPLDASNDDTLKPSDITYTFPKGDYSKREFLNTLYDKTNDAIYDYNTDPLKSNIPYASLIANTNEKAVFGLALDYDRNNLDFHPSEFRMANNMDFLSSNISLRPTSIPAVGVLNYNTFGFCQSGFNPLNFDEDNIEQSSITFGVIDDNSSNAGEYVLCFTNQRNAELWSTGTDMETEVLQDTTKIPKSYIGVHFQNDSTPGSSSCEVSIYQSNNLDTFTDSGFETDPDAELGEMILINKFFLDQVITNQRFAFQFYQENDYNASDTSKIKNYYRLISVNSDTKTEDILQPNNNVLFDSKSFGKNISNDLVKRNFKLDEVPLGSGNFYASGLVPVFAMKDLGPLGGAFYDIEAPFINTSFNPDPPSAVNNVGIGYYSLTVGDNLADIFGDEVISKINPNGITNEKYHTADFSVSQFYQDNLAYNIQVDNLPILTYQSTSKGNQGECNIGGKKPVVLKLNSLFEGKVDNLNSSRLVRSHYENFNKNLKLRNNFGIDTNNFDVSIRRARSNELATEITDASIEIVFDKE